MRKINIALPKGKKLLASAYEVFKKAGYTSAKLEEEIQKKERKQLEYPCDNGEATFILVRIADVPQYVDRNWADIGISAFDCYREYELSSIALNNSMRGDNFLTDILPELRLCDKARFCVAGQPENKEFYEKCKNDQDKILTVATQHPYIATKYFALKGIIADVITIAGSSEVMPKYGEVDTIFDIVESGMALKENGLIVYDEAMTIKTKVLVSKAAYKYDDNIKDMVGRLRNAIE